jgi:hypothetical protein
MHTYDRTFSAPPTVLMRGALSLQATWDCYMHFRISSCSISMRAYKAQAGNPRTIATVSWSAGKNVSIASSDSLMSTGVPNTIVVERNDNRPTLV